MRKRRIEDATLTRLYIDEQKSTQMIAEELKLTCKTVQVNLKRLELTRSFAEARHIANLHNRAPRSAKSKDLDKNAELIKQLYLERKMTTLEIGKRLAVCGQTIRKRLRELGLMRNRSEAVKLTFEQGRQSTFKGRTGDQAINWKGGRLLDKRPGYGYVWIFKPEHPRANKRKYVQEHLLIWEESHGQQLPDDWVIHHINGKRDDNRLGNLLAMPRRCHHSALLIQAMRKRIKELEAELKESRNQLRLT